MPINGFIPEAESTGITDTSLAGTLPSSTTTKTIPENPLKGWEDPRNEDVIWKDKIEVTVPAGTFECWYCQWRDKQWDVHREYYAKGVGLVKSERYTRRGTLLSKFELVSYELK